MESITLGLEAEDTDMDYVTKDTICCQTETKPVIPSQKKIVRSLTSTPACCTFIKSIFLSLT